MSITIVCTCGRSLQVDDAFAGQQGRCPSCGRSIQIPHDGGHITEQAPMPRPRRQAAESAPWASPPKATPLPEPDDDGEAMRLTTHAGTFISTHDDFFATAPPEIGRLYSAFTTLKKDQEPKSPAERAMIGVACFSAGFLITALGIALILRGRVGLADLPIFLLFPSLVGLALVGIALWWMQFNHTCTYVGTKGVATFGCSGDRDRRSRGEVFLFEDANELRISQTRHYYNGVYTGTDYNFAWTNEKGEQIHAIIGRYKSEEGTPGPTDSYHFALMAETAWTMHLYRAIDRTLEAEGRLFFAVKGGDYIELNTGRFVLVQGSNTIKLRADRIEKMTIGNGVVSVWEVGAKEGWFVNKGIHQFMYADLSNARFFMYAVEKLLGIRF